MRVPSLRYSPGYTDNSSIDKVETNLDWHEYFSQFQDMADALPCHIHLPVCLWLMDPRSRAAKKNSSHGNQVLPHDTTHIIHRPCYQRGSLCQDPAGNQTTRRGRRHGRQKKRWEDNIREWTGLKFAKSQRAVENREKWRKLIAKSSVVHQRPSRLKNRWRWW